MAYIRMIGGRLTVQSAGKLQTAKAALPLRPGLSISPTESIT